MTFNIEQFEKMPVVGILRGYTLSAVEEVIPHYLAAGFATLEVTMNSPEVSKMISSLCNTYPDLMIGAGTVCDMNDLEKALDAGASFIVSPIIDKEVISYCVQNGIPNFPGAFTPTEIYIVAQMGATAVKVFPATTLGPSYIKDILAPLSNVKLLPTGGVNVDNINAFFKAGAYGVGMGGSLFDQKMIANKDFEGLAKHFENIYKQVSIGTC